MNKLLLLFVGCFLLNCFAGADEHLTFNNIPIDGSIDNFVKALALQDSGLVKINTYPDGVMLADTLRLEVVTVNTYEDGNVCMVQNVIYFLCDYENLTWEYIYSFYIDTKEFLLKRGEVLLKEVNEISNLSDEQCLDVIKNNRGKLYSAFDAGTGWHVLMLVGENTKERCFYGFQTLFIDKKNSGIVDFAAVYSQF